MERGYDQIQEYQEVYRKLGMTLPKAETIQRMRLWKLQCSLDGQQKWESYLQQWRYTDVVIQDGQDPSKAHGFYYTPAIKE